MSWPFIKTIPEIFIFFRIVRSSSDYLWLPSRNVRARSLPGLLASKAGVGVLAVRRGGRMKNPRRAGGSGDIAGVYE